MVSTERERRFALAAQIQASWYPKRAGAWLKAVPAAQILGPWGSGPLAADPATRTAAGRHVVMEFLEHHYGNCTPEDSAYSTLRDGTWRPVSREEMLACVEAVLAEAAARIAEIETREAEARREAEAGGYLHALGPRELDDLMIDLTALRRWFTAELWGDSEPSWWTNTCLALSPSSPATICRAMAAAPRAALRSRPIVTVRRPAPRRRRRRRTRQASKYEMAVIGFDADILAILWVP